MGYLNPALNNPAKLENFVVSYLACTQAFSGPQGWRDLQIAPGSLLTSLPADVLWNECVTNRPQRTSAGRLLAHRQLVNTCENLSSMKSTFTFVNIFFLC